MNTDEQFRQRLRQALLALGMQRGDQVLQRELAQMLGMQVPRVNRYFRDTVPPLEVMVKLAHALQVDVGWLAFGQLSKAPAPEWVKPPTLNGGGVDQDQTATQALKQGRHIQRLLKGTERRRKKSG